ncbi:MAG: hypothetical protein HQL32_04585 [Planctomycetes bacterium]|nr:hypothetical protein [Planctomycetota bacterium]
MISIMVILPSFLSPVLKQSLVTSRSIICLKNLDNLGSITALYIDDYSQYFPPPGWDGSKPQREVRKHIDYGITWDDRLSDYDDRELSLASKQEIQLGTQNMDVNHSAYQIYVCPEDDIARTNNYLDDASAPRTYAINGNGTKYRGFLRETTETAIGSGGFSVRIDEIDDTQGTIYLAELPSKHTKMGTYTLPNIRIPRESMRYYPDGRTGLHGALKGSYLFTDGHALLLSMPDTVSSSHYFFNSGWKAGDKMWTRQYD